VNVPVNLPAPLAYRLATNFQPVRVFVSDSP
jgi:hypothetical protein